MTLIAAVAALMLTVIAGVAWAADITCTAQNQPCMGTEEDDQIRGGPQADTIFGLGGNDRIGGAFNNDELHGGFGNDTIKGSLGDDTLFGDEGKDELRDTGQNDVDILSGGPGSDRFDVGDGDGQDTVNCGKGRRDTVLDADRGDQISRNCDRVSR